jgi:hypothetical protein
MRTSILSIVILSEGLVAGIGAAPTFVTNLATQLVTTAAKGVGATNNQRILVDPDIQDTVDSWAKGAAATNGLVCAISVDSAYWKGSPKFYVNVINTTTNWIRGYLRLPFEAFADIALLDSGGKPLPKTEAGKRVGSWTDRQIEDWFNELRRKRSSLAVKSHSLTDVVFPLLSTQVSAGINLREMFLLKQAGEYTLHLRMRVAQTKLNAAGKIVLEIMWLPDVVAKVQVRPEDIPPESVLPAGRTNSPAK